VFGAVRAIAGTSPLAGVELVEMDVRSDTSVKEAFQQIVARAGRIDVLVNNAGATIVGAVEETSTTERACCSIRTFSVSYARRKQFYRRCPHAQ
jgi:NAD(P)-dependent dehydrogenase (short-subunit alcohol dehydrogenase family)